MNDVLLKEILNEIEFLSYGGRIAFMVKHEENILRYLVKCIYCCDLSFTDYADKMGDIQYFKCDRCISQDIKDKEIEGEMTCVNCMKKVTSGKEEDYEETSWWYCDKCLELPEVIERLKKKEIDQKNFNRKYADKVINFTY